MVDIKLVAELVSLRAALENYWSAWAIERGRPEAASGKTMCRFTASFLVEVLDGPWRVAGGAPLKEGDAAGYFDGATWHPHYWVTDGQRIVDLCATQFGGTDIILASCDDDRFAANYTPEELAEALEHVSDRTEQWAFDYCAPNGPNAT
jgi:hypothetical protein